MLIVSEVRKAFGRNQVLKGVNIEAEEGQVVGLIGANGCGKSTLLKIIAGLAQADEGTCLFNERDSATSPDVGFMIEEPAFYPNLSGYENLSLIASLFPIARRPDLDWALGKVGLSERKKDKCRTYSLGMKQRLHFALAIMSKPSLLILDEPFNGIDPVTVIVFEDLIRDFAGKGATVLISSHGIRELQTIVNKAYILDSGVIAYQTDKPRDVDLFGVFKDIVANSGTGLR